MRKLICSLCATVFIFLLCGCAVKNQGKESNSNEMNFSQENITTNDESSDMVSSSEKGLTVISDGDVRQRHCNTEAGYYYITSDVIRLKDDSFAYHLMYVDFATQQEIYLCSNSGCQHDTQSCTAVLPMNDFEIESRMFVYQNNLYILSSQPDNDGISFSMQGNETVSVEGNSAVLYRMGLDGGNREKVYTFDSDLTLESTVLSDDTGIYLISKKLESAQNGNSAYVTSSERQIVKLDTSSRKLQTICDMDLEYANTTWEIIGSYDYNIIVEGIVFDTSETDRQQMSDDEYKDTYRNSKTVFATLNLETGDFNEIHSISNTSLHSVAAQNGMLFLSLDTEDAIYSYNLRTGENTVLATLGQNSIYKAFNGMLCTTSWEMTDDYGMNFIDMKSGEVSRCDLTTKTLGWRLELRGETAEKMLVVYDYDAVESSIAQNENTYEINSYKLALIDKNDLYHGINNFQPIQMVGKGY